MKLIVCVVQLCRLHKGEVGFEVGRLQDCTVGCLEVICLDCNLRCRQPKRPDVGGVLGDTAVRHVSLSMPLC